MKRLAVFCLFVLSGALACAQSALAVAPTTTPAAKAIAATLPALAEATSGQLQGIAPTSAPEFPWQGTVCSAEALHVRVDHSADAAIWYYLAAGEAVTVYKAVDGWGEIRMGGWVNLNYICK